MLFTQTFYNMYVRSQKKLENQNIFEENGADERAGKNVGIAFPSTYPLTSTVTNNEVHLQEAGSEMAHSFDLDNFSENGEQRDNND